MLDFQLVQHEVELAPARGSVSEVFPFALTVEHFIHDLDLRAKEPSDQRLVHLLGGFDLLRFRFLLGFFFNFFLGRFIFLFQSFSLVFFSK